MSRPIRENKQQLEIGLSSWKTVQPKGWTVSKREEG